MTKINNSPKEKASDLLKNQDLKRWYDNVKRGSKKTADVYLRRLRAFCENNGKSPLELIKMKEDDLYNLMLDFVSSEQERGMADSYIHSSLKAVKSWLSFKRIFVLGKINLKGTRHTPTLVDEQVPTQAQLRKVFLQATPRDRVCCVLMAHAGLRPRVIGDGNDGLQLKDLPELQIHGDTVDFKHIPTIIRVRPELSKAGHKYMTFLSEEGCEYLREYLEGRIRKGEVLEPSSDLISPKTAKKRFLSTTKIRDSVRHSLRAAGIQNRPYVLRAYFNTQLQIAESKGKMISSYRKFFFGHKGDMEARYSTAKGILTDEMMNDMREAYRRSQAFLQTTASAPDEDDRKLEFRRGMLEMSGLTDDEINSMDLEKMSQEDIWEHIRKKLQGMMLNNASGQKVISSREIEKYINDGWEYLNEIPGNKAIVRIPK